MIVAWFSGGCTSAAACKLTIDKYGKDNIKIIYIETGSHHPNHPIFLTACENWYDMKINILQSTKYKDVFDVIEKQRFINSPYGAKCTSVLKKDVRLEYEKNYPEITHQVWGFEYSPKEQLRAKRLTDNYTKYKHLFPLIENKITKHDALNMLAKAGIKLPAMYLLGYHNSNCVGCVKGGMAYWNKIRIDFPEVFKRMAIVERQINHSCLRKYYLDELPIDAGRGMAPLVYDCGAVGEGCETELIKHFHSRD